MQYAGAYILLSIMYFLEKDLEQIIYESDNRLICERGLPIEGYKIRQLRIGNYGIADLVTFSKETIIDVVGWNDQPVHSINIHISIYELKKGKLDISALGQLCRYRNGIKQYIKSNELFKLADSINYSLYLVGSEVETQSDFVFIEEMVNECEMYTYSYNIDGIKFNKETGYTIINNGF